MKRRWSAIVFVITLIGCNGIQENKNHSIEKPQQEVIKEITATIDSLYQVDQSIQMEIMEAGQNGESERLEALFNQELEIFERHIPILKDIYNQIGYPGIDLIGEEGSGQFFTLVQHADADVAFQAAMLEELTKELHKGNVNPKDYAFLTDRVSIAQNNYQIYGTQVQYNTTHAQAFPRALKDSLEVNKRRKEIGLEPIEYYLNQLSTLHFQMNEARYLAIGITEPQLYDTLNVSVSQ